MGNVTKLRSTINLPYLVVGMDTSSKSFHAVASDRLPSTGDDRIVHARGYSGYSVHPSGDADERRVALWHGARDFVKTLPLDLYSEVHVFIEEPLALKNGKTTRLLGLAAGAIWCAFIGSNVWLHWVDVATWKKAVVGSGAAPKTYIDMWVSTQPDGADWPEQDFNDAHCIMVYGRRMVPRLERLAQDVLSPPPEVS